MTRNGKEAYDCYVEHHHKLNGILMDCEMPEMDGYTATQKIRDLENKLKLTTVPIVAVTAHAIEPYKKRCLESGMNAVLTKPIDIKDVKGHYFFDDVFLESGWAS